MGPSWTEGTRSQRTMEQWISLHNCDVILIVMSCTFVSETRSSKFIIFLFVKILIIFEVLSYFNSKLHDKVLLGDGEM